MRHFAIILSFCLLAAAPLYADDFADLVGKGNEAFENNEYNTALEYYHQAEVERPETPGLDYNIGSALYKEQKYEEAVDRLQKSLATDDVLQQAQAYYNLGNVHFRMDDYQQAIQNYQNSLELNPDDIDAKYNLELARKMLKEQMKPESQQNQQQQQQQQQQEEQQEQQEDQQDKQNPEEQQQQEQQQQQQPQPQPDEEKEMSKEDAERILNALQDDEKDLQKEQQRFRGEGSYQGKDW